LLIGDVPLVGARRAPRAVAASLDGELLTYAQLETLTADLTAALRASGVRRGERVIWQAETCFDALGLYFATARIGAMFVPINPRFTSEEAGRIIGHADPCLILGDAASGHERIGTLLKRADRDPGPLEAPRETDGHVMFYTSGTTGQSKGCILSQRTQRLRSCEKSVWPRGGELCMFPQFHMSGWHRVLEHLIEGNEVSFVRRPDAEELMETITRRKPRSTYCIPAVWQRIFDKDGSRYDLSSLQVVDTGTSMVTPALLDGLARRFPGATTTIVYGSTEVGMATTAGPADGYARATSVGRPSPGVLCELAEDGELIVDSPYLFSGYFRNDEANARAVIAGRYHTGDVAECDEEGRYRIIGRVGDLIRTGGEAVAPTEVEEVLLTCPGIAEIAIVGVPDPTWGQVVTAFVVTNGGPEVTLEALRTHCAAKLVPHKHPRRLELVDSLPRTAATGQIQRRKLLERL
jgi:acyl-CoA synthetase (AMP-forming)/AMP-acid ligase II